METERSLACSDTAPSDRGETRSHYVIVTAVFPPEYGFSARTSENIACELISKNCEVTILAPFPNRPAGQLFAGYRRSLYSSKRMPQGYKVVHCYSTLSPKSRTVTRFLENISFGITSSLKLLTLRKPAAIYANSWPIFASGLMALVAKLRRIPYVVSVQDVYPESMIAQSRLSLKSWPVRSMRRIDKWISHHAAGLIVIGEGFQRTYLFDREVPAARVHLVYNWGEASLREPDTQTSAAFRRKHSIPQDAFLAVFGGNIGQASGAEGLIDAFSRLKDLPIYLLFAGAGSQLKLCRQKAKELGCDRVLFHSPWLAEETETVLGAADVVMLPTVGTQSLASIPSKLISYLLMEKPVVAQVLSESETARMIEKADAGWILPPDDPRPLAEKMRQLASTETHTLLRKGKNGRHFALENLCKESNLPKVVAVIQQAARNSRVSSASH